MKRITERIGFVICNEHEGGPHIHAATFCPPVSFKDVDTLAVALRKAFYPKRSTAKKKRKK